MLNNIEADSLGKRAALANRDDITDVDFEGRGAVDRDVTVTFFVTSVLGDVVKVITTDNDSAFHLGGDYQTFQHTSTNGNITCERTFFIDVVTFDGRLGCFESKTNRAVVAWCTSFQKDLLGAEEDTVLFLE